MLLSPSNILFFQKHHENICFSLGSESNFVLHFYKQPTLNILYKLFIQVLQVCEGLYSEGGTLFLICYEPLGMGQYRDFPCVILLSLTARGGEKILFSIKGVCVLDIMQWTK